MKTILILGDSWGVPNYEGPKCGSEPYEHTEYLLKEKGYKVYNCSQYGGSNLHALNIAKRYFRGEVVHLEPRSLKHKLYENRKPEVIDQKNPKIDWVIWFHTEALRARFNPNLNLLNNLIVSYNIDYQSVKSFLDTLNCKLAVIGGQSPVFKSIFYNYFKPDFLIEDWRSQLIGYKLPEVHWLTQTFWVDQSTDDIEDKIKYLEMSKVVLDAMAKSKHFPDDCHPNGDSHKKLTEMILEKIENI